MMGFVYSGPSPLARTTRFRQCCGHSVSGWEPDVFKFKLCHVTVTVFNLNLCQWTGRKQVVSIMQPEATPLCARYYY